MPLFRQLSASEICLCPPARTRADLDGRRVGPNPCGSRRERPGPPGSSVLRSPIIGLYLDGVSTVNVMLTGLRSAVRRLESADSDQDADGLFIAAFEVANWAVSLDDRIGMSWRPRGGEAPLKAG